MRSLNVLRTAVLAQLNTDAGDAVAPVNLDTEELALEAEAPETEEVKQARKARLDLAREQANKAANDGTAMPPDLLGLAQQEMKACWEQWDGKDGAFAHLKAVKGKMRNISSHIHTIAKACAAAAFTRLEATPDTDPVKLAGSMFRNAMAAAEQGLRGTLDLAQPDAEEKLDEFLKSSWNVYKSQAKSGFDAGFDPRDSETLYAIVKAVKQAKEAKSTGTRKDDKTGTTATTDTTPEQNAQAGEDGGTDEDEEGTDEEEGDASTGEVTDAAHAAQVAQLGENELEIISQKSAKVRGALILLHRAIFSVNLDDANNEERLVNVLRMMTREINKLSPRSGVESADDEGDTDGGAEVDETLTELPTIEASEG